MATIETKLVPFIVPNFATMEQPAGRREDGLRGLPGIPIKDLPIETLRALAQEWLASLYDRAGKPYDWRFD